MRPSGIDSCEWVVPIRAIGQVKDLEILRSSSGQVGEAIIRNLNLTDALKPGEYLDFEKKAFKDKSIVTPHNDADREAYMVEQMSQQRTPTCVLAASAHIVRIIRLLQDRIVNFRIEKSELDYGGREIQRQRQE